MTQAPRPICRDALRVYFLGQVEGHAGRYRACLPRRLRIEYKQQTRLGEQLAPVLYDARGGEDEDRFVVSLEKDGAPACIVEFSR